ncbi:hypothetical protein M3202_21525 [Alkalihalobacillus oceani]|uniref:DUF4365 domain-containing protein n=1 Tax=Halalkalibacter oceani TaxID=1653776 RepID=A0A9X2DU00_9BACI|nr:hypothetical protein [Halalkalibacter oceani]MCM3716626.1 hypothetical protein [Halalkalibacter oceani]
MIQMPKGKIERIAVYAIILETNKPSSALMANIPDGDKGISFDGDIAVYKDHSETVESLIGKVPVQVKGTQVDKFSNGTRTFPMELKHIKNYYDSNGVILFVVEILKNGDTKIFYKQLLPNELREILIKYGEKKQQKQRNIELRPLSETTLDIVCKNFIEESKKQPQVLIENNPFKDDEYTSFELTSLTFNPIKAETSNIFEHDFTIYGIKETLSVPLSQARIQSYSSEFTEIFITNGRLHKLQTQFTFEKSSSILLIENSLEITFKKDNFNFNLVRLNSLSSQLKVLPFILDFLYSKEIELRTNDLKLENLHLVDTVKVTKAFERLYSTFKNLKIIFEELNIDLDTRIDSESLDLNSLIDQITSLVRMYLDNDYSTFKNPEKARFALFPLGELKLLFFYNPDSENLLMDAFSDKIIQMDTRIAVDDIANPHSPYILIPYHTLAVAVNLKIEQIKKSFDNINPFLNDISSDLTNQFCLNCISAFDLSQNFAFLDLADHIYNKFDGVVSFRNIVLVNQLQIKIRRNGSLSDKDYEKLINLKQLNQSDIVLQFCASVLLKSKIESTSFFSQLGFEEQKFIKKYPIYTIYKNLINE